MGKEKTLIGKENYLFLQNDSNRELEVHNNNLCVVSKNFHLKFEKYLSKYLLIVFPNKSLVHQRYLPDGFDLKYRPGIDMYKKYLNDRIIDLYEYLKNEDSFYKTDTHMNLNGAYISYEVVISKLRAIFNIQVEKPNIHLQKKECILADLNLGLGDLTWEMNLGQQDLKDKSDIYYYSDDIEPIYTRYKISSSDKHLAILNYNLEYCNTQYDGTVIDWNIVSNYIIYSINNEVKQKEKILIFYDSFLLSSLSLWRQAFHEVYFIKNTFNPEMVKKINPDYILEFRVERFLN